MGDFLLITNYADIFIIRHGTAVARNNNGNLARKGKFVKSSCDFKGIPLNTG
jgi:hypothetical protein